METSTGTAPAWVAWLADHAALSSKRPFPVSTTVKKRWRGQSALTTSVACRSACRSILSFILKRRKRRAPPKQDLILLQCRLRAPPYLLKLTLPRPLHRPSPLSPPTVWHLQMTRLPAKLHLLLSRVLLWNQALPNISDSLWGPRLDLLYFLSPHRWFPDPHGQRLCQCREM